MTVIPKEFSISEVAHSVGVSTQTLRNWEASFLIPRSHRRGIRGNRYWLESEVEEIWRYRQENYRW